MSDTLAPTVPSFPTIAPLAALEGVVRLTHLGVIRVAGDDAVSFLQGQLTNDFALLKPDTARLAAFLTAKGRMQASFVGLIRVPGEVLLVCSRDILEPVRKRLSMFVLRAKAKLTDASDEIALYGLAGDTVAQLAGRELPAWARQDVGEAQIVGLPPAAGQARALWLAPAGSAAPSGQPLDESLWRWGETASGVATLTSPVVEAFVPQMLNYESVGGINFKKGCYPGQEVVARSQFRGTLKRRAYLAQSDASVASGAEVFHQADASQPCGTVVQAASAPDGGWLAIVSMQTSAADGGRLTVGAADGPALSLRALPYPLLEDI
ncbi:folate-binding protein [Xylophilus sp. GOD-11R]|uniref:CAF17-like 4Fe-4S cluster assembly/insertion protein YgfZ n=1 Tax=Xylophilus sp. GOD-11R TaxID=3089814 RepID=UPI00298CA728|nr:folate-binding protein [Xylophilus sp. GOD-11R]WPB59241.1 folate-binding protein [Xylophilus sp. GOD-11R]